MSSTLVAALHQEERAIIAELRASRPFQRLEGIQRLLSLYDVQPSVAAGLEGLGTPEPERPAVPLRAVPPAISAIPMPGPVLDPTPAEAPRPQGIADAQGEPASVVSSVRAALLGIGKT